MSSESGGGSCSQVVLFPSDFTALVNELFRNKMAGDRVMDDANERRKLKGKHAGAAEVGLVKGSARSLSPY
eukprot:5734664-Pyramimonas_sp.AAC.1